MPTSLPTFRNSMLLRLLPLAVVPVVALTVGLWVLVTLAQTNSTSQIQQAAAQTMADRITDRLNAAAGLLDHARKTIRLDASAASTALRSLIDASPLFQTAMILDATGVVRTLEVRDDLSARKRDLQGIDLSRLAAKLAPTTQVATSSQDTFSLLDNQPLLAVHAKLSDGRTLVAFLDPAVLVQGIQPVDSKRAPWLLTTSGRQAIAYSTAGSPETIAQMLRGDQSQSGLAAEFSRAAITPSGLIVWYGGSSADAAATWATLRTGVAIAGALAAALAAAASLVLSFRFARPLRQLKDQAAEAIAKSDPSALGRQRSAETEAIAQNLRQTLDADSQQAMRYAAMQRALASSAVPGKGQLPDEALAEVASALADLTGARCVLVAEWTTAAKPRARVLAARTAIPLPADFSYELTSHPSSKLAEGEPIAVACNVSQQYRESPLLRLVGAEGYLAVPLVACDGGVIGHIEIIDDHNLGLTDELRDLLLISAARAAGALEQIRARRRIRENDELYRTITQDRQEIICRWTADTTLTYVGDAFCRMAGKSHDQLLGSLLLTLLHEDDRELLRSRSMELTASRPSVSMDLRLRDARDQDIWHRWTTRALADAKGRIVEYQGTAHNITQLLDLQAAISEAETRFAALADNADESFWITDWMTHRCIYANHAFQTLWGVSLDNARGTPMVWSTRVHEEDRANVVRGYLLHAAEGPYTQTYRIIGPDGGTRLIHDRAIPVRDAEGRVYRIANIAKEIRAT